MFAHANQFRIDSELDGTHRHRPVEMSLGFPTDRGIHVIKSGVDGEQDTTEHTQHKKQYDEQSVVGDGRAADSETSKRIEDFCLGLELSEMCDGRWEVWMQVQGMSEMLNSLMAAAACQVYLADSEMLQPGVLVRSTRFQRSPG